MHVPAFLNKVHVYEYMYKYVYMYNWNEMIPIWLV